MSTDRYIGIEIGGTKQQIVVGTAEGQILSSVSVCLGSTVTAQDILLWIQNQVHVLLQAYPISGIGVGFGGPLERSTGRVLSSLQVPGWEDFALKAWFAERFPLPVTIANDTFTGGLAELCCGAGQGAEHLFYTNIGTGIGGGLYWQGRGFDGSGFGAAYLGNTLVPNWLGRPGEAIRMELLVSGRSIQNRLSTPGYVPHDSVLFDLTTGEGQQRTAAELGQAVRMGDAFACAELDRIATSFSIALVNLLATTGVTRVVIGGGVAKLGDILFDRIRARTEELAFIANAGRYTILPSRLLDDAVPVGALLLAAQGERLFL